MHTSLSRTHSVIHYHVEFHINTPGGVVNWFKQHEDAGEKDIWPISSTNEVTDLFATKMHEARMALPPTGYKWSGGTRACSRLVMMLLMRWQVTSHGKNKTERFSN